MLLRENLSQDLTNTVHLHDTHEVVNWELREAPS